MELSSWNNLLGFLLKTGRVEFVIYIYIYIYIYNVMVLKLFSSFCFCFFIFVLPFSFSSWTHSSCFFYVRRHVIMSVVTFTIKDLDPYFGSHTHTHTHTHTLSLSPPLEVIIYEVNNRTSTSLPVIHAHNRHIYDQGLDPYFGTVSLSLYKLFMRRTTLPLSFIIYILLRHSFSSTLLCSTSLCH